MNKRSITVKIAVLSLGFIGLCNVFIAPAMATIADAFPEVSRTNIQLIMTFGLFGFFPMTIITGALAAKFRTKSLSLAGTALMIAGALFPLAIHSSIFHLYLSQLMMGAGGGMLMTLSSALIPKLFPNDAESSRLFGFSGACQNAGFMIAMFAAGFLAASQWSNVYWTGLLFIPTFFLVLIFLPKDEKPRVLASRAEKQGSPAPRLKGWHPSAYPIVIFIFLFAIIFATVMINSAMLLDEQLRQGSAVAGTIASVTNFVSILAGILYKNIVDVLKQNILAAGAALMTAGLFFSFIATNVPVYFTGFALVNLGFTFGFTGGMHAIAKVAPPEKITSSMGLFMGCQSLGSMVCPFVINPIADFVTGVSSALGNYQVTAVFGLVVVVYAFVWGAKHRRNYHTLPETAAL